jgi:hypothetical protein
MPHPGSSTPTAGYAPRSKENTSIPKLHANAHSSFAIAQGETNTSAPTRWLAKPNLYIHTQEWDSATERNGV